MDDLTAQIDTLTARLDRLSTREADAEESYADLMAIVIETNAEINAGEEPSEISGEIGERVLEKLKEFLREKLADTAEHLEFCQSWSIAAVGWPPAVTVTVTFGHAS